MLGEDWGEMKVNELNRADLWWLWVVSSEDFNIVIRFNLFMLGEDMGK